MHNRVYWWDALLPGYHIPVPLSISPEKLSNRAGAALIHPPTDTYIHVCIRLLPLEDHNGVDPNRFDFSVPENEATEPVIVLTAARSHETLTTVAGRSHKRSIVQVFRLQQKREKLKSRLRVVLSPAVSK